MTDFISRQDAIEAIDKLPTKDTPIEFYEVYRMAINDAEWTIDALPSAEYSKLLQTTLNGDLISRADAIEAVIRHRDQITDQINELESLPSAEAEPKMTEEVREALMRLTMCARKECDMCKYKDECGFDFQYEISTDNMNTLADALLRSKCEVDAKSSEAVQGWVPCSERLPNVGEDVLFCDSKMTERGCLKADGDWWQFGRYPAMPKEKVTAWMPVPRPYEGSESDEID